MPACLHACWFCVACISNVSLVYSARIPHVFCMYSARILQVPWAHLYSARIAHVFCMYSACILHVFSADLPSAYNIRQRKKTMRRSEVAGLQVKCILELKRFCHPYTYPTLENLETWDQTLIYIPLDATEYSVEGACFTGKMQINWIGQLMERPHQFALHADGKHKLHHGKWILQTLGSHYLKWDNNYKTLKTSFVPLIYQFCAQHESAGSCRMLLDALLVVGKRYFPDMTLLPGATVSDHSDRCVCLLYVQYALRILNAA